MGSPLRLVATVFLCAFFFRGGMTRYHRVRAGQTRDEMENSGSEASIVVKRTHVVVTHRYNSAKVSVLVRAGCNYTLL